MSTTKTTPQRTLVTLLLDRSGSMETIRDETVGAFNVYLTTLQFDEKAQIDFTLIQFDSVSVDKVCVAIPVGQAPLLTKDTYVPRASTPLIDAACKTIRAVERQVGDDRETKVVICIQTDGHENSSVEHTWNDLNALIKEKTAQGWQFNFLGAGIDAYDQGRQMGISDSKVLAYDLKSSGPAFVAVADKTLSFARGERKDTDFSYSDKRRAGDRYDATRGHRRGRPDRGRPQAEVDDFFL